MKRRIFVCAFLMLALRSTAHAFVVDAFLSGAQYIQQQAYEAFMKLKIIEEIAILKQNYDASVRYYDYFKRLNQGHGIVYNVEQQLKAAGGRMEENLRYSIDRDFLNTYNTNTKVDQFFRTIDRSVATNMRYVGNEIRDLGSNRQIGLSVARNADGLTPKDAANLAAKAQGLQLQYLSQIHEDNLRLIEIQTMRLAAETQRREAEQQLINGLRKSAQQKFPDLPQEGPQ